MGCDHSRSDVYCANSGGNHSARFKQCLVGSGNERHEDGSDATNDTKREKPQVKARARSPYSALLAENSVVKPPVTDDLSDAAHFPAKGDGYIIIRCNRGGEKNTRQ